jgi:hypothetical protein
MDFYSGNGVRTPISAPVLNSLLRHLQDDTQFSAGTRAKA